MAVRRTRALVALAALCFATNALAGAWTFKSVGALQVSDNAAPAAPGTFSAGDVLILESWVVSNGATRTLSTPSGWTLIQTMSAATGAFDGRRFCKVAVGADTMPTIDWSGSGNQVATFVAAFGGPTDPNCGAMVHNSADQSQPGGDGLFDSLALTVSQTNTLIISSGIKQQDSTGVDYMTISCPSDVNGGALAVRSVGSAFEEQFKSCYRIETTAVSPATSTFPITGTQRNTNQTSGVISLLQQDASGFSAGPSYSAQSNTVIRATATATAGSTLRCGLWTLGATPPTGAQIAAGTGAHGTNSAATTGSSQNLDITATDSPTFPAYDPYCIIDTAGVYTPATPPATTSTCTTAPASFAYVSCPSGLVSVTATGSIPKRFNDADLITLGYKTQTANFTVGAALVDKTSGAWGFVLLDTDIGTSGVLTVNRYSTAVFADNDVLTDSAGGAAVVNGAEATYLAVATTDILVVPTTVSPSSASLSVDTSGQYVYTASGRQSAVNGLIYHRATAAYTTLDTDIWFNNSAPAPNGAPILRPTYQNGTAIDNNIGANFSDADADTLTYAVIAGTLPHGTTFNSTTGHLAGTVDTNGESDLTVIAWDQAFAVGTLQVNVTVSNTLVKSPDCMTALTTLSACEAAYLATFEGRVTFNEQPKCNNKYAANYVIATSPTKNAQMAANTKVAISYSTGNCGAQLAPMVSCLRMTITACDTLLANTYGVAVGLNSSSANCPASGVSSGLIFSQTPKEGSKVYNPGTLNVDYCP